MQGRVISSDHAAAEVVKQYYLLAFAGAVAVPALEHIQFGWNQPN